MNEADLEKKVTGYLDPHAKVARAVGWAMVVANLAYVGVDVFKVQPVGAAFAAVTAVVLFWVLVKSRPVATS